MPHPTRVTARHVGVALGTLLLLLVLAIPGRADSRPAPAAQEEDGPIVEILPLEGLLDPPTAGAIIDLVEKSQESELIVIQVNAPGAVSVNMEELLDRMMRSTTPIAVFVGPQGAAATAEGGAVGLWLRADIGAIAPDATVGPANPVTLGHEDQEAALEMVNWGINGLGIPPAQEGTTVHELLTSRLDAEQLTDVVDLEVPGLEALIQELDGTTVMTTRGAVTLDLPADEVTVRFHSLGLVRRLLHAASTGPFIWLLLTVGLGMLLFELFQPGFGVAGIAGAVTVAIGIFGLTVLPVTWWAVALVVLGMVLFAVDTAIAGFGPVTAAAVGSLTLGSANFYQADALALDWWLIAATVATAFVFFVFVMTSLLRAQAGPAEDAVAELIGRRGVVRSVLNPEGHVFVDGALWRARWADDREAARVGTVVRVRAIDGPLVLVEPEDVPEGTAGSTPDASSASSS